MEKKLIDKMVDRFLCWKLPADFAPDYGISFDSHNGQYVPKGTNLLTATQAQQMLEHVTAEMWIKTTDQMPPENEFVLLFNGNWRGVGKLDRENFDAEFDNECEQWQDETTDYIVPVPTHWMPLPAPPVAE